MYGMAVHRAVIDSGDSISGPTVHLVNARYDDGAILSQEEVPVLEGDDPDTLQKRVLSAEHRIYPATLDAVQKGLIGIYDDPSDSVVRPLCTGADYCEAAKIVRTAFSAISPLIAANTR